MAFNIANFKSQALPYGGYRPSNFDILVAVPTALNINHTAVSTFKVTAFAASIPAMPLSGSEAAYFGRRIKLAGDRTYEDWRVTVYIDEGFETRSMFENWNNGINTIVSNIRLPALSQEQYKTDWTVYQYGKEGSQTRSYKMIGAWPRLLSDVELNWENGNQVARFGLTISYDYWIPDTELSSYSSDNAYGPLINDPGNTPP